MLVGEYDDSLVRVLLPGLPVGHAVVDRATLRVTPETPWR
jgi:hypothetical protein